MIESTPIFSLCGLSAANGKTPVLSSINMFAVVSLQDKAIALDDVHFLPVRQQARTHSPSPRNSRTAAATASAPLGTQGP